MGKYLSKEEAEQIAGEIDNEGFSYWITEGYAESALEDHPELLKLAREAKEALDRIESALMAEDAIWY